MFASLGNIVFEGLKGFNEFSHKGSTTYAEHALITGKPRLQQTGIELDILKITIKLHVSFCNPALEVDNLNIARANSEILPLVFGNSNYVGKYVITDLETKVTQTDGVGNVLIAECTLTLKEFVEADPLGAKKTSAKNNAFALNAKNLTKTVTKAPVGSASNQVMNSLKDAKQGTAKIAKDANEIKRVEAKAQELSKRMEANIKKVQTAFESMQSKLNQATTLAGRAIALVNNLKTAITVVKNLKNRFPITNGADAVNLSQSLTKVTKDVGGSASILSGFLATQKHIPFP